MEGKFRGSGTGVKEQKELMAQLPQGWKRILQKYRTTSGERFAAYHGDEYEFRKIKQGTETQAIRLYYDWDKYWRVLVAREFETEGGRVTKITRHDDYRFEDFEQAKAKALEIMRQL